MGFTAAVQASFGGDTKELQGKSGEALGIIKSFSNTAKAVLGEVGAGFVSGFLLTDLAAKISSFLSSVVEKAMHLRAVSMELGVTTENVQLFDKAAVKAGSTVEAATKVWEKARDALSRLADGDEAATEAFAKLGLNAKDFIGLSLDSALEKIAKAYQDNKTEAGAYNAYIEILGKRGAPQLNAALQQLAEKGFGGLAAANQNLSDTLKTESVDAVSQLMLKFNEYMGRMKNFLGNLAGGFLESLQIVGGLAAAVVNKIQGIETSWDDVLLMTKKQSQPLEDMNNATEAGNKKLKEKKGILDSFTQYQVDTLKAMEIGLTGQEKINVLMREYNALDMASLNTSLTQLERDAAKEQAAKVLNELKKEQADLDKKNLENAEKEALAYIKLYDKAKAIQDKNKLEALPLQEQVLALQKQEYDLKQAMAKLDKESPDYLQDVIKLDGIDKDLKEKILALTKQTTEETKKQAETRKQAIEREQQERENAGHAHAADTQITEVHGVYVGKERSEQDFANASDAVLEEIIRRNQQRIDTINQRKYDTGAAGAAAGYLVEGLAIMHIGLDSQAAQNVLNQRRGLRGANYNDALTDYQGDPLNFDALYRSSQENVDQTTRIADAVDALGRRIDNASNKISQSYIGGG